MFPAGEKYLLHKKGHTGSPQTVKMQIVEYFVKRQALEKLYNLQSHINNIHK